MKIIYTVLLVFFLYPCQGQGLSKNITSGEARSLKKSLSNQLPDTAKVDKLIRLAYFNIWKPGEAKTDLDSADNYLQQAMRLVNPMVARPYEGRLLIAQSQLFRERQQQFAGKQFIQRAIHLLTAGSDKKSLGLAYFEMSQYYNYTNPPEMLEKLRFVKMALELFRQSGNIELKAYCLKMLADLHNFNGDAEKALLEAKSALNAYQAIHYQQLQGVYELIGSIYYEKGDFVQSLNYRLKALKTAVLAKDSTLQFCQINNGIAMTFMRLNNFPKAINYLRSAMAVAEKINDRATVITLSFNIAESYVSEGRVQSALTFLNSLPQKYIGIKDLSQDFPIAVIYLEIYGALKDFTKGNRYSRQLAYVAELPQTNNSFKNYIYIGLIRYYFIARNYEAARNCILKNKLILLQLKNPAGMASNYKSWFRLDTMQRDYKSAVKHLLLRNKLADSISLENQKVDLKRITNFYETAQKENAIKLLQARTKLQQIQLQHAESSKRWFLGFAFILLLLLVILIDRYAVKRRMNNILKEQYQETRLVNENLVEEKTDLIAEKDDLITQKEWLLSEVHHRVRNNLHTVVSLLESQAVFLKNDALNAIEKSQHRIYAMSLIHQKIYNDEHLKAVDISRFIPELVRYLNDSYRSHQEIHFKLDLEQVKVSVTQSIPLALIINEIITNAIVHAFHKKASGSISISVHQTDDLVTLDIADNGVGIDPGKCILPSDTLGMVLINGLSEDIYAEINIKNDHGTRVTLVFPTGLILDQEDNDYS